VLDALPVRMGANGAVRGETGIGEPWRWSSWINFGWFVWFLRRGRGGGETESERKGGVRAARIQA
jgi:beta-lactamase class D